VSIQDFALINGRLAFIGDYRHLVGNYKDRPKAFCPVKGCGNEMELVLTKDENIRRSHFRHKQLNAEHSPETLWHYGTKYHLAYQLKNGAKIKLKWKCQSGICKSNEPLPALLSKKLTDIDIDERKIGIYLPDITLYHQDLPLAVIEVFNTHISTDEKLKYYDEIQLPWFEIKVQSQKDYEAIVAWSGGEGLQPFISRACYPEILPKICPHCEDILRKQKEEKEKRLQQAEAQRQADLAQWNAQKLAMEKAREYKHKIGEKLLYIVFDGTPALLGISLYCTECKSHFPQYFSFAGAVTFKINEPINRFGKLCTCDLVFYNGDSQIVGFVLLKKANSDNEGVKLTIRNNYKKPFIEIKVNKNVNGFKIVDSSHHGLLSKDYLCKPCESKIQEQRILEQEQKRLAIQSEREVLLVKLNYYFDINTSDFSEDDKRQLAKLIHYTQEKVDKLQIELVRL
jgi:hypothetical protein